tara:strand:+ start:807 stop:992 length:186 start_codon:yes stop_codon:yes gene_type:complete
MTNYCKMFEEYLPCCDIKIRYQMSITIYNIDAFDGLVNPFSYCPFCGNKIKLTKEWREQNI